MANRSEQKPLKVAFVLPSFTGGGAERVIFNLAGGLDRGRFQPELVVFNARGQLVTVVPKGVPVHDLGTARLRHAIGGLLRRLQSLEPDVVISSLGYLNVALLALRGRLPRRTRLLVREANLPSLSLPASEWPTLLPLAYRLLYRRADAVICTSERMAAEFTGRFRVPAAKIRLLSNPVDIETIRAAAVRPVRAPGPGLRLVAAGRMTTNRHKGFDRLFDLFVRTPPDSRLEIFGSGPEEDTLRAQADGLGLGARVNFQGFDPVPWPYYAGADAFLMPSRWEGMPNAALEALACGTPVIATPESGGIGEVAREAADGAVQVVDFGNDFLAAMTSMTPAGAPDRPRPSLLPSRFERSKVCRRFEDILLEGA